MSMFPKKNIHKANVKPWKSLEGRRQWGVVQYTFCVYFSMRVII